MLPHKPDYKGVTLETLVADGSPEYDPETGERFDAPYRPVRMSMDEMIEALTGEASKWQQWTAKEFVGEPIDDCVPPPMTPHKVRGQRDGHLLCSRCGDWQPVSAFSRNKQSPRGYHYWCKSCRREQERATYRRTSRKSA